MAARADRRIGRFALLGWAFGFVFTGLLAILLFGLSVLGLVLAPAMVGMYALYALVPATRGFTRWQRRWAGRALGREIVAPYLPATGQGVRGRRPQLRARPGELAGPAMAVLRLLHR